MNDTTVTVDANTSPAQSAIGGLRSMFDGLRSTLAGLGVASQKAFAAVVKGAKLAVAAVKKIGSAIGKVVGGLGKIAKKVSRGFKTGLKGVTSFFMKQMKRAAMAVMAMVAVYKLLEKLSSDYETDKDTLNYLILFKEKVQEIVDTVKSWIYNMFDVDLIFRQLATAASEFSDRIKDITANTNGAKISLTGFFSFAAGFFVRGTKWILWGAKTAFNWMQRITRFFRQFGLRLDIIKEEFKLVGNVIKGLGALVFAAMIMPLQLVAQAILGILGLVPDFIANNSEIYQRMETAVSTMSSTMTIAQNSLVADAEASVTAIRSNVTEIASLQDKIVTIGENARESIRGVNQEYERATEILTALQDVIGNMEFAPIVPLPDPDDPKPDPDPKGERGEGDQWAELSLESFTELSISLLGSLTTAFDTTLAAGKFFFLDYLAFTNNAKEKIQEGIRIVEDREALRREREAELLTRQNEVRWAAEQVEEEILNKRKEAYANAALAITGSLMDMAIAGKFSLQTIFDVVGNELMAKGAASTLEAAMMLMGPKSALAGPMLAAGLAGMAGGRLLKSGIIPGAGKASVAKPRATPHHVRMQQQQVQSSNITEIHNSFGDLQDPNYIMKRVAKYVEGGQRRGYYA